MSIISAGGAVVGAGGAAGAYQISRSLRFNSADSAYLNRTPASASNKKVMTWNLWTKKSSIASANKYLFACNDEYIRFNDTITDTLRVKVASSNLITTQLFRDPAAWGMLTIAVDTTQATASNRVKVYWNGVQITAFGTETYPSQNADATFNTADLHRIGSYAPTAEGFYDGYMAEVNFIDGQALTPTSFGEYNTDTGVWQPKAYTGSYGTNGFYLNFSDNASTTTLGDDLSGNGNDWTTNNFSVTAGAGNDSLVDTPTNYGTDTGVGGEVRGNYCTMNPLNTYSSITLSNGNLQLALTEAAYRKSVATMAFPSSGSYYVEADSSGRDYISFGIVTPQAPLSDAVGNTATGYGVITSTVNWDKKDNGVTSGNFWTLSLTTTATLQIAVDTTSGKLWVGYDNTWLDGSGGTTGNPSAGTNPTFTIDTSRTYLPSFGGYQSDSVVLNINAGQRPFAYTAPSGFKALVTTNLPTPTIEDGSEYFDTKLWAGNSSTQSIALEFAPNLIWTKSRGDAAGHAWYDVLRGTGAQISSNSTDAETTGYNAITSFSSNAISLGADNTGTNNGRTNETGRNYVGWVWKANGAGVSNTAGTITSTVSANTDSGFSIVTYTGTGSAATIGHGLGAVPRMIIVKNRDAADAWQVYHAANTANPETDYLVLNTTAATADAADRWNDTLPTSTVFSIGNGVEVNTNTEDYVAYVFAAIPGYSAFGSYTGNGSADGPFVFTNFRPRYVLTKRTDSTAAWYVHDTARNTYNVCNLALSPDLADAEVSANNNMDILSNGFKIRNSGAWINASGGTYIYMAFAENPFSLSLAR